MQTRDRKFRSERQGRGKQGNVRDPGVFREYKPRKLGKRGRLLRPRPKVENYATYRAWVEAYLKWLRTPVRPS